MEEEVKSLNKRMDSYCNPPGHTCMHPDAVHRIICRYTAMLAKVVSTECWDAYAAVCKAGSSTIDSVLMKQSFLYKFRL